MLFNAGTFFPGLPAGKTPSPGAPRRPLPGGARLAPAVPIKKCYHHNYISGEMAYSMALRDDDQLTVIPTAARQPHLAFRVGDVLAALPLRNIREVVRRPDVLSVPLAPPGLEGLFNLHGTVTALVNLHQVLGLPPSPPDDGTRIIILSQDAPVGLQVDRIVGLIDAAPEPLDNATAEPAPLDADLLAGAVPATEHRPAVLILALDRVQHRVLASAASRTLRTAAAAPMTVPVAAPAQPSPTSLLIGFEAGGEEYALPMAIVREIIRRPETIARVPHAESHILGVVTLRDRLIPLVALRPLLGHPPSAPDADMRIVVIAFGEYRIGLLADRMRGILRVDSSRIDPVPVLLGREGGDIAAICRLDGGRRLVAVLAPDRLLRGDGLHQLLGEEEQADMTVNPADMTTMREPFVVFRLGRNEYGLPAASVEEILTMPEHLTPVPKAPDFIEGVINRRGRVLPVIDQRRRFALPGAGSMPGRHIVVAALDTTRAGLIVDGVTGVLKIPLDAIEPAPDLSTEQIQLISRVAKLPDRMILLLDPVHLLARHEADQLAGIDAAADRPAS
jgi:purine-binding chemotaxis protein CheW